MQDRLDNLEKEIQKIQERNLRVEADKTWETSLFRVATISVIIYSIACAVLFLLNVDNFFLSALVPPLGYFLSVQSLPAIKKWWIRRNPKH